jgi:hypothetical protein
MAKLSVYIPDELLERAREADPELSPSSVLQEALRLRVTDHRPRPYATLSDELAIEQDAAQRFVLSRVREAWENGYRVGLEFAKELPWEAFEAFATTDWTSQSMAESFAEEEFPILNPSPEETDLVLDFERLLQVAQDRCGRRLRLTDGGVPTGLGAEGFVDAIRQVWEGGASIEVASPNASGVESDAEPR